MAKKSLEEQAEIIIRQAEERGVENNFLFVTTFDRYLTQIKILEELKPSIEAEGMTVTKEYVKGRKNVYTNPAISEYNKTTDSANRTVTTLVKIINGFGSNTEKEEKDPLIELLNGGDSE
jgi:hypothetical protein|nr:MAG TPA: terminase small subunit [Caudoviricetes sp.]